MLFICILVSKNLTLIVLFLFIKFKIIVSIIKILLIYAFYYFILISQSFSNFLKRKPFFFHLFELKFIVKFKWILIVLLKFWFFLDRNKSTFVWHTINRTLITYFIFFWIHFILSIYIFIWFLDLLKNFFFF